MSTLRSAACRPWPRRAGNLACVGARPIGVTNCLNFGNPEKPEVMWQLEQAIDGIAEACRSFEIPVTGGNVSLYNETEGKPIRPTPVLGIVGLIDDLKVSVRPGFKRTGDIVVLLGETLDELGASEYLNALHGIEAGPVPVLDLEREKKVQELCLQAMEAGLLGSAHDLSEGGLTVALAECSFMARGMTGCRIELRSDIRADALLFGETQSRILVTCREKDLDALAGLARKIGAKAKVIGRTGGDSIVITRNGKRLVDIKVAEACSRWKNAIPEYFREK